MGRPRLSLVVPLLCLVQHLALGQFAGYNYGPDATIRIRRQISQPRREVVRENNDVRVRLEIRQLEQDSDVWTLYILGLSMMQYADMSLDTSWFGISGIHGMPHKSWGGVGPTPGNENTGYCTHFSILFPTWHRPYLVLYEQILQGLIQFIASLWPDGERQRFQEAALRFRIPYWDWAADPPSGQSVLPQSVAGSPFVDVDGPNGRQRIANPLFSFSFNPLSATGFTQPPWNQWPTTLRAPTNRGPNAQSDNALVASDLDRNRVSQMQRLYNLFSYYNDYIYLANEEWTPQLSNGSLESLESLHDTIHLLTGGQNARMGHMSYPPYAAFDPIFWLHHCMVDRIFALWQTLHPETWITPHRALQSTHTTSRGEIQDSQTALTPFYSSDNGTFWTSDGVRDHTRFGYTYPELLSESASRTEERQAAVRRAVNRLYGRQSPAVLFLSSTNLASQRARSGRLGGDATSLEMASLSRTTNERIFHGSNRYHEWTANIRVEKQACDGPFSILIFLGCPPDDPLDWMSSPSHIGTMGVWTAGKQDHGENGQMAMDGLYVSGTVPLTAALVQKIAAGELASLEPNEVEFYLKMKLEKRVLGPGGRVWDADKVKGLKIQIVSSLVKAPSREEELPVRASTIVHFDL